MRLPCRKGGSPRGCSAAVSVWSLLFPLYAGPTRNGTPNGVSVCNAPVTRGVICGPGSALCCGLQVGTSLAQSRDENRGSRGGEAGTDRNRCKR